MKAWVKNPDWKKTFWGPNYPRLSQIKEKWDPDMVFYVTPGINADHMAARGDRLCKIQELEATVNNMAPTGDNRNGVRYAGDKVTFPLLFSGNASQPIEWDITTSKPRKSPKLGTNPDPQASIPKAQIQQSGKSS